MHDLLLSLLLLPPGLAPTQTQEIQETREWSTSTPEAEGLDPAPLERFHAAVEAGTHGNVDRFVVVVDGKLVVDRSYAVDYVALTKGKSGLLGHGPGAEPDPDVQPEMNYLDPNTHPFKEGRDVHTLQSVTKSVAATLIGIALRRGEIEGLDAKVLSFLEDHDLSGVAEEMWEVTLEDLLTMQSGIAFNELTAPLTLENDVVRLERSKDWIQYTLDQPMDAEPGKKWAYNSGGSQLMSGILRKATGRFADDYAQAHLFGPLGIDDFHWKRSPAGFPDTLGGLYLAADDLARIGQLYLQDGVWEGERILPEGWVAAATARHVDSVPGGGGYGYQWWRPDRDGVTVWAGMGFGDQFLLVLPEHGVVGAITSWNIFGGVERSVRDGFLSALIEAGH
jgi:CubicO group peptidase (beta-lactamase class C family)